METVIASVITGLVAIIVCVISNHSQNEKSRALIEYQIGELSKRVEAHNNLIERMYKVEKTTAIQVEQIKVINHRLSDIEAKI